MSRIGKYPYRVIIFSALGNELKMETHNYENFAAACSFREIALRRPRTKKVEVVIVLDESTPSHPD
jgi:hypothetical protein